MNDAGEMTTTPLPATTTSNQFPNPNPNPNNVTHLEPSFKSTNRRPGGFAVTAANAGSERREREKEKERTKLRERHRRAITSRMLSGLRQYGNFHLPSRADMNDVLSALARNAGWIVDPDGTTYRRPEAAGLPIRSSESTLSGSSLKNCSMKAPLDCQPRALRIDENLSPASLYSVIVTDMETKSEKYTSTSNVDSAESLEAHQLIHDVQSGWREDNFAGTPYVPVYVKLASGIINSYCQLVDPEGIRQELKHLKSLNVDGVFVECWWGIVEGWSPRKYVWLGYRDVFMIIREYQLKLQVALMFHEYGGSDAGNAFISLPHWVLEIGKDNQDIFFTDREGQRNTECLSWGIDKERVLRGRTGIEIPTVYWWYKTASHAAELTAGYYNPTNRDGYSPVLEILKRHSVTMKFVCPAAPLHFQGNEDALADPDGLSWQVLNTAWDHGLTIAGQNGEPCYDRGEHIKITETSKPRNDPDHHHFAFFVYQLPSPFSQRPYSFTELDYLIKAMHGEVGHDQENAEV